MGYLQSRGTTVLGHHPYASYLLPFVFLVAGVSFWKASEAMTPRLYFLICCSAAVALAALWGSMLTNPSLLSPVCQRLALYMTACALAAGFWLRDRTAGTLLAAMGFTTFTALCLAQTVNFDGVPLQGNREQYERIMHARERIEAIRDARAPVFWFNREEPNFYEYLALNSTYLAEFSRISDNFPQGCTAAVDSRALIVVLSKNKGAAESAQSALDLCWQPFGTRPRIDSVEQLIGGKGPYTMAMLRVEARPPSKAAPGELVATIPLERLQLGAPGASFERWPEGLSVTTPSGFGAFAARVSLGLDSRQQEKLSVYVRARVLEGEVGFGILDSSGRKFLLERRMWPLSSMSEVILLVPSPSMAGNLVVDNRTPTEAPSTVLIEAIEIRRAP